MYNNSSQTIIIDTGSSMIKSGYAHELRPHLCFPSIVWRQLGMLSIGQANEAAGERAMCYPRIYWRTPIRHGLVTPTSVDSNSGWSDVELLWSNVQWKIGSDYSLLLTEAPNNSGESRGMMARIAFQELLVPSLYIANQAVLTLIASGKSSGMVLESGDGATHSVPVYEGFALKHASYSSDLGGETVTHCLKSKLMERGEKLERETVRDIKEKFAFISNDFENQLRNPISPVTYELPDESSITIGNELFECSEVLFQPNLMKLDCKGIHENIFPSIEKCDEEIRSEFYRNIVLGGGNTIFKGFPERIENELKGITTKEFSIDKTNHGPNSAWIGGSILASSSIYESLCITLAEFEEFGENIVYRKFF